MAREKVLLVRAPNLYKSEQWKKQGVLRTPTNMALLGAYLRESGPYEPEILDLETYNLNSIPEIAGTISSRNSRYVGFTTLTPRFPTIMRIAQELKTQSPNVTTIVGGPHISGRPQDCRYPGIDYGITGEGEQAFLELLDNLRQGEDPSEIKNLVHKVDGNVVVNPRRQFMKDLDSLPYPAWDLIDLSQYKEPAFFGQEPHAGVFTTRGCPQDCVFCASKVTWDRRLRYRSLDNVMGEFEDLAKRGVRNLYFYDDQFALKPERAIDLCNRMIQTGIDFRYVVQIRADSVNPELARVLKKSGCLSAAIGVETGNEEMLQRIRKKETKDEIRAAVTMLKEAGVPITTSYIIGLPGDTHETIQQTLEFARELNTQQRKFMLLTPVPGTDVYNLAVQKGLLDPDDLDQMENTTFYDRTAVNLSDVSTEELLRYQDQAYREFDKQTPK